MTDKTKNILSGISVMLSAVSNSALKGLVNKPYTESENFTIAKICICSVVSMILIVVSTYKNKSMNIPSKILSLMLFLLNLLIVLLMVNRVF